MSTGFVWHERMMWHDAGSAAAGGLSHNSRFQPGNHFEHPETKRRLKNLLDAYDITPQLVSVAPFEASDEDILRVHTPDYLERLKQVDETGGNTGLDVFDTAIMAPGGLGIARLSAGGGIAAVAAVLSGEVDNAYALTRPPGHHAEADRGRGFCILANIAIAIRAAQARFGVERVAVVDWDVHHGNGTERIFWEDPSVLTISLHQEQLYPHDAGDVSDRGGGAGAGFNINVPLPPGSNGETYHYAFDRVVEPALRRFRPDLIIVACGFDACAMDPLGRMMLVSDHFAELTKRMLDCAEELCGGKLVLCHEGGYSEGYVPFCGAAVIETLLGGEKRVEDPLAPLLRMSGGQQLTALQREAVDNAAS
jgi:acetoin utilization deacetylase AcuC-like enzyme